MLSVKNRRSWSLKPFLKSLWNFSFNERKFKYELPHHNMKKPKRFGEETWSIWGSSMDLEDSPMDDSTLEREYREKGRAHEIFEL